MFTGLLNTMAVPMGFVEIGGQQQRYCACHLSSSSNSAVSQTTGVLSPSSPQGLSSLPLPDLIVSHNPTTSQQSVEHSRTFVFPPSGNGRTSSSRTSTASQTTPSLTRTPVYAQFSSTIIDSPIIRPSSTIFSLPASPSTSSQAPENICSDMTSENSPHRTELPNLEAQSNADIRLLDSSSSALKRRRSKALGYSPPFESNIVLDPPEDGNSSKAESTLTTAQSPPSEASSIELSASIIFNPVLPQNSDLLQESESQTERLSELVENSESDELASALPSRPSNSSDHDFVVNHCFPIFGGSFSLDERQALEKVKRNLDHIVAVQDKLVSDPYYDWPSPVSMAGIHRNQASKDTIEYPHSYSENRSVNYRPDQPRTYVRRSMMDRYHEIPHRRLLNDRNHLRMSWELPPSPPSPPQVVSQPVVPTDSRCHYSAPDAAYRDRESKFLMKCVGEDLRNIADQFEVSCREAGPRRGLPAMLSEAFLDGSAAKAALGKCIVVSVVAVLCWKLCSSATGSSR